VYLIGYEKDKATMNHVTLNNGVKMPLLGFGALAWLLAQQPWIVPIPGTTQMPHLLENLGAMRVLVTRPELAELTASASAIRIRGERLPPAVQAFSDVEAPPRQ
jgi:aryl-alcohol dehydrogenase-like predicted oxidoreductase